jgi:hypothetical protein
VSTELFEKAAEADARILKVDQLMESGADPTPEQGIGYLLTFDVGRVLVLPDREKACLALREVPSAEEIEEIQLLSLSEEEPWWRVMGQSLTGAWPGARGEGASSSAGDPDEIRLQFRADEENPKVISLRYGGGRVHVQQKENP